MDSIISVLHFMLSLSLEAVPVWVFYIMADPLLLFFVVLSFVGLGLGLIRRIIH